MKALFVELMSHPEDFPVYVNPALVAVVQQAEDALYTKLGYATSSGLVFLSVKGLPGRVLQAFEKAESINLAKACGPLEAQHFVTEAQIGEAALPKDVSITGLSSGDIHFNGPVSIKVNTDA